MTTKPKARKFRIRRSPTAANSAVSAAEQAAQADAIAAATDAAKESEAVYSQNQTIRPSADGYFPADASARAGEVSSANEVAGEQDIDAIRREGLTGRQLRMARRVAQKHGLAPTSDFDAVRLLRSKGIDPFQRSNMLELVVPGGKPSKADAKERVQLPQTVRAEGTNLPAESLSPAERREIEITDIQNQMASRRRRKTLLLLTRLSFFVFLPTLLAGWYYYNIATPMYEAKSEFLILQADSTAGGALGGLLPTQYATSQDAIAVQSYLQSKEAMLRLNDELGFGAHFAQDWIDPLQRLEPDASREAIYKVFKKDVRIGYDPTEGVIKMQVIAATPEASAQFSERLIKYAEERVDNLSIDKRRDAMLTAEESLARAKKERREAQQVLVELQEGTFIDPEGEIGSIRALISNVELQLQEKEIQLSSLLNNARPNQPRVDAARKDIKNLKEELDRQQKRMNQASVGGQSLAAKTARIQMAQADLITADAFLQSALTAEKQTVLEMQRQVRYLTVPVRPIPPEDATYPRAFENTLLVFLILSGVYLMISLTASVLREQVST